MSIATIERVDAIEAPVRVPIAIVGAGACGLTAALRVHEAGLACVVLERDRAPAGSTALSSGFVPACVTVAQRAAGVEDSVARFLADIEGKARASAAPHLARAYAAASGTAIDWLAKHEAMPFELLDGFLYPGHSVRRMHAMPERTGRALIDRLAGRVAAHDIALLCDAHVTTLLVAPDDRVLGLRYQRPDGSRETLACDALILACNGYGGDPERIRRHLPDMATAEFAGHAGNDGSALDWGDALGAACADLGGYQGHGSWATPHGILVTWALMTEGGIQVDSTGERFHDESGGYSEAATAVLARPGGIAWNLFDSSLDSLARDFPDYREARAVGAVREAADLDSLAGVIGCAPAALATTLAQVERSARTGTPDRFGRRHSRPLGWPMRAIRVTGALFHTQGGLDIDAHCHVLRPDGRPLPNLLAAGGAARGVSGNAVWGYLSGNGLLSAIAGGYIAGGSAATMVAGRPDRAIGAPPINRTGSDE